MAAVTATVLGVQLIRGNDDARTDSVALAVGNLKRAIVSITPGGTAVAGGTDTLDCDLSAAISGSTRNGLTPTVRTVALEQAITTQTSAGVEVTHAGFMTLSSNTVSITPKSTGWVTGSTNSTIAASLPYVRPYAVFVTYTEA
jgi:hypothetical protein